MIKLIHHGLKILMLCCATTGGVMAQSNESIPLPAPSLSDKNSLQKLLQQRRSIREYQEAALSLPEVGQLLWAAQGITDRRGYRTAPSAGALYPLEIYLVAGNVDGLAAGIYHYQPVTHQLIKIGAGDQRNALTRPALSQPCVKDAAAVIVIAAVYERTTLKYGQRGIRYVHIEAGHVGQNIYLQVESLGLGTVIVGAFDDNDVQALLKLPDDTLPLVLMPVGRK